MGEFAEEAATDGDELMAVRPWLGAIKEPQNFKALRQPDSAPKVTLDLKYAYGYRVKDCRNNLKYVNDDEIAFHCAGVGVVMNTKLNA